MKLSDAVFLLVIAAAVAFFRTRKLKSQGLIRNQGTSFAHSCFTYTLRSLSYRDVMGALDQIDFERIKLKKLSIGFNNEQNCIIISNASSLAQWTARLVLVADNGTQCQYSFQFLNYPESIPQTMMIFHTALEKMFLEFDWNTVVESVIMQTRTKANKAAFWTGIGSDKVEVDR